MLAFRDQVVVVTGANGDIGRAICQAFVLSGAFVVLVGRRAEALAKAEKEFGLPQDRIYRCPTDLTDDTAVENLVWEVMERYQRVDGLVHAAGLYSAHSVEASSMQDFDALHAVNLRAPYFLTRALLPALTATQGQIAFLNSSAGRRASGGIASYAASKHALAAFADSLRDEVNPLGIRVLSLFIGRTAGRLQRSIYESQGRPYEAEQLLQPSDVAQVLMDAMGLTRTAEVTELEIRPMHRD